jgi:hypothetical protein
MFTRRDIRMPNIYNIGDRVVIRAYEDTPVESRTKGMARLSGKKGTIVDKLYSECFDGFVYTIKFDDFDMPSKKLWTEEMLYILKEIPVRYEYEFDYLEDVVVARLCEVKGEEKTEIERGHGHIIHEGALGIAQAASYALKKIYEKMNGGTL